MTARNALEIPSRHGNRLTYRDGRVTDLDGNPLPPEAPPQASAQTILRAVPVSVSKQARPSAKRSPTATKPVAKAPLPTPATPATAPPPAPKPAPKTGRSTSGTASARYASGQKTHLGKGFRPDDYHARPGSIAARIRLRLQGMGDPTTAIVTRSEIIAGYDAPRSNWCNYFGRAIGAGQLKYVQDAAGILVGIALPEYNAAPPSGTTAGPSLAELADQVEQCQRTAAQLTELLAITRRHLVALATPT